MRFIATLFNRGGLLALGLLAFLSACTVVVEDNPPPGPGPGPGPGYCTREYDPVCGRRDGDRKTFANACLARAQDYKILYQGECRKQNDDDNGGFCTREYRPVCARRGDELRTFPNRCEAESSNWRVIDQGPC